MPLSCLICQKKRFTVVRRKLRYDIARDVLRCANCGYVFLRPLSKGRRAFYEGKYRKIYGPSLKKTSTSRDIFNTYLPYQGDIIRRVTHLLKPNTKVLEVGCSAGHFLSSIRKLAKTRVGIELNTQDVAFIRRNLDFPVYDRPIESLTIPEGPFDLAVSLQVLEHIDDPVSFLRGIAKHLKPGGWLYLELPNLHDIILDGFRSKGYADFYFREPHVSYFTASTLKRLLAKAGFRGTISTVQRYNLMNHLHWLMTDKPQERFQIGNGKPILIDDDANLPPKARADFNQFMIRADAEYKRLIVRHGLGESLTFLGSVTR